MGHPSRRPHPLPAAVVLTASGHESTRLAVTRRVVGRRSAAVAIAGVMLPQLAAARIAGGTGMSSQAPDPLISTTATLTAS
jgi:hypothetical protein